MRHRLQHTVVALLLIASPGVLFSQGGSTYSSLGIGDLRSWVGAQYDALSGTQIGMPTPYGVNLVNPSLMGFTPTTRIQAGYHFNQHINSDGTNSLAQNSGSFDGLVAMFSVDTARGFAVSLSLAPSSKVAYLLQRNISAAYDGGTVTGKSVQLGEGGVSNASLAASVRLTKNLRFGVGVSGLFGLMTYSDKLFIDGNYSQVFSTQTFDLRGFMYRTGLYWEPIQNFGIGAFIAGGGNGTTIVTRRAAGSVGGHVYIDTVLSNEVDTPLPLQYGLGVSTPVGRGRIGADVQINDFQGMNVNLRSDASYTNGIRSSIGYAYFGSQNPGAEFLDRIGWYLGASYQTGYVTYQNSTIREYSGSTGISFPLGGNAMVDAAVSLGKRETDVVDSISELFGRLTVTVSIGEVWFKPFARD